MKKPTKAPKEINRDYVNLSNASIDEIITKVENKNKKILNGLSVFLNVSLILFTYILITLSYTVRLLALVLQY